MSKSSLITHSGLSICVFLKLLLIHAGAQVLPTVILLQIQTARCWHSSKLTTPHLFLTWRPTLQSTTLSPWKKNLTSKPCWRKSRQSSSSLKLLWCLERARCQREQIKTLSLAATLSAAQSPAAAIVEGTDSHSCSCRQCW